MITREKNDFQREKKKDIIAEKIEEMKLHHQNEIGSLRAELCEIKNVFKNGFSNLASAASNPPPPNVQPPPPASGNCSQSFGQSGGFRMGDSSGQFSQSVASPAQQQNQQLSQQYVTPQMLHKIYW